MAVHSALSDVAAPSAESDVAVQSRPSHPSRSTHRLEPSFSGPGSNSRNMAPPPVPPGDTPPGTGQYPRGSPCTGPPFHGHHAAAAAGPPVDPPGVGTVTGPLAAGPSATMQGAYRGPSRHCLMTGRTPSPSQQAPTPSPRRSIKVCRIHSCSKDKTHFCFWVGVLRCDKCSSCVIYKCSNFNWELSLVNFLLKQKHNIFSFNIWYIKAFSPSLKHSLVNSILRGRK